jgi:hypothetical protein
VFMEPENRVSTLVELYKNLLESPTVVFRFSMKLMFCLIGEPSSGENSEIAPNPVYNTKSNSNGDASKEDEGKRKKKCLVQ